MSNIEFPCINCITLGMCKARYQNEKKSLHIKELNDAGDNLIVEAHMIRKCRLLKDWVYSIDGKVYMPLECSYEFHDFYRNGELNDT